jgi:hypothetical protein
MSAYTESTTSLKFNLEGILLEPSWGNKAGESNENPSLGKKCLHDECSARMCVVMQKPATRMQEI